MTREDIFEAAAQIFRQKGFHGASMNDIAKSVNLQKASMSFQQMVQVRNKLVSAYQDIMNMQV